MRVEFQQTLDLEIISCEKVMESLYNSKVPGEQTRYLILQGHRSGLLRAKLLLDQCPNPFGPNKE
jgi:hypothetical protein